MNKHDPATKVGPRTPQAGPDSLTLMWSAVSSQLSAVSCQESGARSQQSRLAWTEKRSPAVSSDLVAARRQSRTGLAACNHAPPLRIVSTRRAAGHELDEGSSILWNDIANSVDYPHQLGLLAKKWDRRGPRTLPKDPSLSNQPSRRQSWSAAHGLLARASIHVKVRPYRQEERR